MIGGPSQHAIFKLKAGSCKQAYIGRLQALHKEPARCKFGMAALPARHPTGLSGVQPDRLDNTAHMVLHEFSEMRQRFNEMCVRQGQRAVVVEADNAEVDAVSTACCIIFRACRARKLDLEFGSSNHSPICVADSPCLHCVL